MLLHDASGQNPFAADEYIRGHHARSVLCLPLPKQTRLVGVLYLENNLTPHVFTPARMAILKLLASQAAISLENTRLYGDLQEREARVRRLVDSNIVGVLIFDFDRRILEANDRFSACCSMVVKFVRMVCAGPIRRPLNGASETNARRRISS